MARRRNRTITKMALLLMASPVFAPLALADDVFVDSRALVRHGAKDTPDVTPMSEALTAPPMLPYHFIGPQPYQPNLAPLNTGSGVQAMMGYYGAGNLTSSALSGNTQGEDGSISGLVRRDAGGSYHDGSGAKVATGYDRDSEYLMER